MKGGHLKAGFVNQNGGFDSVGALESLQAAQVSSLNGQFIQLSFEEAWKSTHGTIVSLQARLGADSHMIITFLKFIYKSVTKIPGVSKLLYPIVKKIRKTDFDFDHATSLDMRILFLESVIAGLEERVTKIENKS